MFSWSQFGFLDVMGLFVAAVSLVENALNPMRCRILYSHYILSSSVISNYMKSSFKFTHLSNLTWIHFKM